MIEPNKLSPFRHFCITIGAIPSSYKESLTYYEMLEWLCKYLQDTVIPAVNNNAEAVDELQAAYVTLKDYVDHYFDNLDIQEEINNKLDEMADSGQLTDIIAQYLQLSGVLCFNTLSDLAAAENITEGSSCYILGEDTYNDGKCAFYKIRQLTVHDTIDGYNIVALDISDTLIAERLPNYYDNKTISIENDLDDLTKEFNNNKQGTLNLMNNMIYDFGNRYSQGIAITGKNLYVYASDNKLMKFDLDTLTYVNQTTVDLEHGNDMCIIGNYIYAAPADSIKKIIKYDITGNTTEEINVSIDEGQVVAICKENDDNLILLGDTGFGSSFVDSSFYRYTISSGTLTKLNFSSDTVLNYYAAQTIEYLNGYIYFLVSTPDQIIKIKVDGNDLTLENIYNLPDIDNLGLNIGEYEGIAVCKQYGDNCLMLSSHIVDSELGRTLKFYVINPINNVPLYPVNYPDVFSTETADYNINLYIDNTSSLIETGSVNYPFHTLERALNCARNRKQVSNILIKNTAGTTFNLYCDSIKHVNCSINCIASNVILNYQRILHSNVIIDNDVSMTLKNKVYSGKENYGTINSSTVILKNCNLDVQDGIVVHKSTIKLVSVTGTANNSDNFIFKLRHLSVSMDGINWSNWTTNSKKYYSIYGASKLEKVSDDGGTQASQQTFFTNNIDTSGSTAICVIFSGKHYTD